MDIIGVGQHERKMIQKALSPSHMRSDGMAVSCIRFALRNFIARHVFRILMDGLCMAFTSGYCNFTKECSDEMYYDIYAN